MSTTTTLTTAAGQRLAYTDHGGTGPAVVVLHSFLMDGSMFEPQVQAWAGEFRTIAVDERGHGGTPAEAPFDHWDVARDVIALLDHLGIARAAVVGTSQGGFVGLRAALLAPQRIGALALLGTSADAENPQVANSYRELAGAWLANGPAEPLLDTVATICLGAYPAQQWKAKWRQVDGARFERILTTLVERDSLLDRLGEIACPVMVFHGSADAAYPVAKAQEIVDGIPTARPLVLVEGGAHFLSLTDAGAVNPPLTDFLRTHA
jgi:pimeloyl-ACP methyl ester carboxylesterase